MLSNLTGDEAFEEPVTAALRKRAGVLVANQNPTRGPEGLTDISGRPSDGASQ